MIRRPPRSTRTDTLFPYTTLFRSLRQHLDAQRLQDRVRGMRYALGKGAENARLRFDKVYFQPASRSRSAMLFQHIGQPHQFGGKLYHGRASPNDSNRKMVVTSDERRVGNECVSTCRSRWLAGT